MRFNDLSTDRQTQTHACRFGCHKRLEQTVRQLWRDARAGVCDNDLHHPQFRDCPRANDKLAPVDLLHRLDGVAHEVEHDLLDLHVIDEDRRQGVIEFERCAHPALSCPNESERERFLDQLVEALNTALRLSLADKSPQATDDVPGALSLADRLFHHLGDAFGTAPTGGEQLPAGLQIIRHRGQRLVKLVGHRRGHLPHHAEPRGVQQLGLEILDAALCLLPFGQIANKAGEISVARESKLADLQLHRKGLAALAQTDDHAPDPDDAALAGAKIAIEIAVMSFAIGWRHQDFDVAADHFRVVIAEQPLRRRAEGLDAPFGIDDHDRIRNSVEDRTETQLALALGKLGRLAIGDVADDPDKDRLVAVAGLADGKIHRKYRPIFAPPHDLAPDSYNFLLAGAQIVREIRVMLARIGLGHQHFDIASDQLLRGIAEEPLGRMVN